MKQFLKYTLATIAGIFIACGIMLFVGFSLLGGLTMSMVDRPTIVQENSIFVLDLNGIIEERHRQDPINELLGEENSMYGLDEILVAIEKAGTDAKIKGIYIKAGAFSCSSATLQEIRRALLKFKETGKFIVSYGGTYTQSAYYLASVADELILNPQGNILWHGMAAEIMFYKDLLKKIGVEMQVFRVGSYKSAIEPYTETRMSEASKEQTSEYVQSIWNQILTDISLSRGISTTDLNALADNSLGFSKAEDYIRYEMADTLMYRDQVAGYLKKLMGVTHFDDINLLTYSDMLSIPTTPVVTDSGSIAIYYAYGEIYDGVLPSYDAVGINAGKVIRDLEKLQKDDNIKAVVLRVNSPGGSAYASEQIWHSVVQLREKKPVVVSMGDYAASGGYYISCAADYIIAESTTLTGSIGIFGIVPDASELITDKLGVHFDGVKTNRLADMGTLARPLNTEERALFQNMINNGYNLFIKRCADGRKMNIEEMQKIAEGRVWTGKNAKILGLVDELGGINTAIETAAKLADIQDYIVEKYPEQEDFWATLLSTTSNRYFHSHIHNFLGEYYNVILTLKNIDQKARIQARIPYEISIR